MASLSGREIASCRCKDLIVLVALAILSSCAQVAVNGSGGSTSRGGAASDTTAPTLTEFSPADNATDVNTGANLTLTFSEVVDVESGSIVIYRSSDDGVFETIPVGDSRVAGTGTQSITINPSGTFASGTEYYVQIADTAFDDTSGNSYSGMSDKTTWSFTTTASADVTNPAVSSFVPADDSSEINGSSNLVINFDENVDVETGNIVIYKSSDDSVVEVVDVTSGKVTGTGTSTITINPTANIPDDASYYIQIDATAFDDSAGNSYVGISDKTTWNFSTGDYTAPTVDSFSPADNSTGVSAGTNLVINFSEAVHINTGNIVIYLASDDSVFETIDVAGVQVTGDTTATITIDPSGTLAENTQYYVQIPSTAFHDGNTQQNPYAGISDKTTWSFTTADTTNPTISTLSPVDNATGVSPTANLVMTFVEAVDVESGNIVIYRTSDDNVMETIDVTSGLVTGTGTTTITINPSITLGDNTEYYILVDATAFDDASGNSYAGISSSTAWSFTTSDLNNPILSTLSPADNSTGVSQNANLVITFNENVDVESGNIVIYRTSDNNVMETIDVTSGLVTGTGTPTITINPSVTLGASTEYYVLVDATAFDDASGNSYAGITSTTAWSFTTGAVDVVKPDVAIDEKSGQSDPASALPVEFDVVFSEAIDPSTFTISDITQNGTASGITWTITDSGDSTTFSLKATVVTGAGTLVPSIAAGIVEDLAGNTNTVSTATDNSVTYNPGSRTITLNSTGCNDSTARIGVASPPFCTAQAAVDEAIAANATPTNPVVIEVANETFGNVTLSSAFGSNISWAAIGGSPVIGNISSSGANGANGASAQTGSHDGFGGCDGSSNGVQGGDGSSAFNITISSDGNITFGNISANGGNGGNGGGGSLDCVGAFELSPGDGGLAGAAGNIVLSGVLASAVSARGGAGGSGGASGGSTNSAGADGLDGGTITLTNSTVSSTATQGGSPGSDSNPSPTVVGADGGNQYLSNSAVTGSCTAYATADVTSPGDCRYGGIVYDDAGDSSCGSLSLAGSDACSPVSSGMVNGAYCDGGLSISASIDDSGGIDNNYTLNWSNGSSGYYSVSVSVGSTGLTYSTFTSDITTTWNSPGGPGTLTLTVSDAVCTSNDTPGVDSAAYSD